MTKHSLLKRSPILTLFFAIMSFLFGSTAVATPVVLEFWHPYGPPWDAIMERSAEAFNESQDQIYVKMVQNPGNVDQLKTAVAAAIGPDLAHVWGIAPTYALADDEILLPLNTYLERDDTWNADDIYPAFLDAYTYDGQIYALPAAAQPTSLVWNKTTFASMGVDPEVGPNDQTELEDYIKRLTSFTSDGKLDQVGFLVELWGGPMNWAYHWGGSFYSAAEQRITASNPVIVEAFSWVRDLYMNQYGGSGAISEWRGRTGGNPLYVGKQAMSTYSHYHYYLAHLNAPDDFDYGFSPIPVMGPPDSALKGPIVHSDANVVLATTKYPKEAVKALIYITVGEGWLHGFLSVSGHPSASHSTNMFAMDEGFVPDWYPEKLWMQNGQVLLNARPWPKIPVLSQLDAEVGRAWSQIINGEQPPESALKQVDRTVQALLEEALKRK